VAAAAARAAQTGRPFRDVLLESGSGLDTGQIDATLDPAGYLGAAAEFVRRALAAHGQAERMLAQPGGEP
jgi:3-carboxy-cis,cis-muconate cycloisomerase